MAQHISVRMPLRAFIERHLDAADHELAPLDQPVQIVADSRVVHPNGLLDGVPGCGGVRRLRIRLNMKRARTAISSSGAMLISKEVVLAGSAPIACRTSIAVPCFWSRSNRSVTAWFGIVTVKFPTGCRSWPWIWVVLRDSKSFADATLFRSTWLMKSE